jgi:hypothetical protein
MVLAALGADFYAAALGNGSKIASTSPGEGPAAAIPGDGSKVARAASVAGFSAASLGDGSGGMALLATSGGLATIYLPRCRVVGRTFEAVLTYLSTSLGRLHLRHKNLGVGLAAI